MKLKPILEAIKLAGSTGDLDNALRDIKSLGYINPLDDRENIIDNKVGFEVSKFDGAIWIHSIRSFEKGSGYASQVLKKICEIADKHQVKLRLSAKPFGNGGLTKVQLVTWYKKYGFKPRKFGDMERLPVSQ